MPVWITGDCHGSINISKLNTKNFPQQKEMNKENDFLIVCGDAGWVWNNPQTNEEKYWLNWLNNKNFTTLFIDGNHEAFPLLNSYPVTQFCGGKVHQIMSSVYHLMRGQVFNIENKRIFTMGGAESIDKMHRIEGKSWWSQEMPSYEEYEEAMNSLESNNWHVDYVITHCAPNSILNQIIPDAGFNQLTNFLEVIIKNDLQYKKWYFAHYHVDKQIDDNHTCIYNQIIKIE